jgi:hypothetical protein
MCPTTPQNKGRCCLVLRYVYIKRRLYQVIPRKENLNFCLCYRVTLLHAVMLQHGKQLSLYQSISQKAKIHLLCSDNSSKWRSQFCMQNSGRLRENSFPTTEPFYLILSADCLRSLQSYRIADCLELLKFSWQCNG